MVEEMAAALEGHVEDSESSCLLLVPALSAESGAQCTGGRKLVAHPHTPTPVEAQKAAKRRGRRIAKMEPAAKCLNRHGLESTELARAVRGAFAPRSPLTRAPARPD